MIHAKWPVLFLPGKCARFWLLLPMLLQGCRHEMTHLGEPKDRPFTVEWRDSLDHLSAVHFVTATTGWAVGLSGVILATTDGGKSWNPQKSEIMADLHSVCFANATTGWAVGTKGVILATTDGGKNWNQQKSGTTKDIRSVFFVKNSMMGWAVGDEGTIVATRDGGK